MKKNCIHGTGVNQYCAMCGTNRIIAPLPVPINDEDVKNYLTGKTQKDIISSLESEVERLKKEKELIIDKYVGLEERNEKSEILLEACRKANNFLSEEIEQLKSSMRENGHYQIEDLNPDFVKTILGINERLFGKGEDNKEDVELCDKCGLGKVYYDKTCKDCYYQ